VNAHSPAPRPAPVPPQPSIAPALSVVVATHDNLPSLRRCLDAWRAHAGDAAVELIVVEDGCTDGTPEYLAELSATPWGRRALRVLHAGDAHELVCTNLGLAAARAPLVASWHDDMYLQAGWLVPELLATFRAYPEIGLLSLSRGLTFSPVDEPLGRWEDTLDWRRVQSTIGPPPLNWARLQEVHGVMRPWVVRAACVARVGPLDEAFRPTEWDEADLCFRIREAGWRVATHGYERGGAYHHAVSTTYARTPSARRMAAALRNARLFFERWSDRVRADSGVPLRHWRRRATPAGWAAMAAQAARTVLQRGARR